MEKYIGLGLGIAALVVPIRFCCSEVDDTSLAPKIDDENVSKNNSQKYHSNASGSIDDIANTSNIITYDSNSMQTTYTVSSSDDRLLQSLADEYLNQTLFKNTNYAPNLREPFIDFLRACYHNDSEALDEAYQGAQTLFMEQTDCIAIFNPESLGTYEAWNCNQDYDSPRVEVYPGTYYETVAIFNALTGNNEQDHLPLFCPDPSIIYEDKEDPTNSSIFSQDEDGTLILTFTYSPPPPDH